jgi:membrane protein DedA with SNARE-associated domain
MMDIFSPAGIGHLVQAYGLWALFALVMLESMGVPLPGETALITAAIYAGSSHQVGVGAVILTAAIAAIVGDNLGYLTGRSLGPRLLLRYGKFIQITEARLKLGEYLFERHGGKIVFFGRFVAFLRVFAALLAGANHMRWSTFLVMNAAGGLVWATLFGGGAYFFGERVIAVAGPASLLLLAVALALIVTGIFYLRRYERMLEERVRVRIPKDTL